MTRRAKLAIAARGLPQRGRAAVAVAVRLSPQGAGLLDARAVESRTGLGDESVGALDGGANRTRVLAAAGQDGGEGDLRLELEHSKTLARVPIDRVTSRRKRLVEPSALQMGARQVTSLR